MARGVLLTAIPASFSPVTVDPGQRVKATIKVRCTQGQGTLWAGGYLSHGADSSQWPTWPGRKSFYVYAGADNPAGSRNAKIGISQGQERTIVFQSDPVEIYQGVTELRAIWYCGLFDEAAGVWTRFDDFGSHPGAVKIRPPAPAKASPEIVSWSLDKYGVYAGDTITATLVVRNKGGQPGTMRLKGFIYYYGGYYDGVYAGRFTKRNKDYCSASKESDWDYVDSYLQPGESKTVKMYKANVACGDNTAFDNAQRFTIDWMLTCRETGETDTEQGYFRYFRR